MQTVTVDWNGHRVDAARVDLIEATVFELTTTTVRRTEQAIAAVAASGHRRSPAIEVAGRMLLRSEGLASSAIEGLRAPVVDVARAEVDSTSDGIAAWVADNLAVVVEAIADPSPIDAELLLSWHRRLMQHSNTLAPHHVGAWRDRLGWIGGANPIVATHVAVPAEDIAAAMEDLIAFVSRTDLDPVTQAAIAHAQFETIHPFADGNGRIGRVLIARSLCRSIGVDFPPPLSIPFARDIGGYQAGLTLYRQGFIDHWVRWFADAVVSAAAIAATAVQSIEELETDWNHRATSLRSDAGARRLLETLGAQPVLTVDMAAEALGSSRASARSAVSALVAIGVLEEVGARQTPPRGRPPRWWAATELLALIGH